MNAIHETSTAFDLGEFIPSKVKVNWYYLPVIGLFFICWSGAIELIQPFVNRYGEFQDLAANITGLVCGFLAANLVTWLLPMNSE